MSRLVAQLEPFPARHPPVPPGIDPPALVTGQNADAAMAVTYSGLQDLPDELPQEGLLQRAKPSRQPERPAFSPAQRRGAISAMARPRAAAVAVSPTASGRHASYANDNPFVEKSALQQSCAILVPSSTWSKMNTICCSPNFDRFKACFPVDLRKRK